jgi:hypothetical protein
VEYFLHPFYQKEVRVVDKRDYLHERYYLVEFFENVIFIPAWMADAEKCQQCILQQQPQCSINALLDLYDFLANFSF